MKMQKRVPINGGPVWQKSIGRVPDAEHLLCPMSGKDFVLHVENMNQSLHFGQQLETILVSIHRNRCKHKISRFSSN